MKLFLFLYCALITVSMFSMPLHRAIVSTDSHPNYIEFWPLVASGWKKIVGIKPTLLLVAAADVYVDETLGDVIRFEPIVGIPKAFQAQVIRLLAPALFPDEVSIISDIDMIPLSRSYFVDALTNQSEDNFVVFNENEWIYRNEKRFPMCYNAAKGTTWKQLFGVNNLEDIREKIIEWHNLGWGWNTDELILGQYVYEWISSNNRVVRLGYNASHGRIDRLYWGGFDEAAIKAGAYHDSHMPRPYHDHKDSIDRLARLAGILEAAA